MVVSAVLFHSRQQGSSHHVAPLLVGVDLCCQKTLFVSTRTAGSIVFGVFFGEPDKTASGHISLFLSGGVPIMRNYD